MIGRRHARSSSPEPVSPAAIEFGGPGPLGRVAIMTGMHAPSQRMQDSTSVGPYRSIVTAESAETTAGSDEMTITDALIAAARERSRLSSSDRKIG